MTKHSFFSRLCDRVSAFRSDASGNIVITFALAMIPIVGMTGAAVDYSRGSSAKAAMQAATDAAALILSKEAQSLSATDLNTKAKTYFLANFNRPDVTNITVTPTFTEPASGNFTLNLVSSGKIK